MCSLKIVTCSDLLTADGKGWMCSLKIVTSSDLLKADGKGWICCSIDSILLQPLAVLPCLDGAFGFAQSF